MKKFLRILLLVFFSLVAGCSSNPPTPQEQLTTIATILSKGYEMSAQQRQKIDDQVNQAKEFMKVGSNEEARKILSTVLADLEVLVETDRFNKSE